MKVLIYTENLIFYLEEKAFFATDIHQGFQ